MKLKTTLVILIILFFNNLGYSQKYFPGEVILKNGTKLTGLLYLPFVLNQKSIYYKSTEKAVERKIKSDSVNRLSMISDGGKTNTLVNIVYSKRKKDNGFVLLVTEGFANLYFNGDNGISVDKHGDLIPMATSVAGRSMPEFYYYIQCKDEQYPTLLAITSPSKTMFGQTRTFRKAAAEYFHDWPELVNRINDKEFTVNDIEKVVSLYNEHMLNK